MNFSNSCYTFEIRTSANSLRSYKDCRKAVNRCLRQAWICDVWKVTETLRLGNFLGAFQQFISVHVADVLWWFVDLLVVGWRLLNWLVGVLRLLYRLRCAEQRRQDDDDRQPRRTWRWTAPVPSSDDQTPRCRPVHLTSTGFSRSRSPRLGLANFCSVNSLCDGWSPDCQMRSGQSRRLHHAVLVCWREGGWRVVGWQGTSNPLPRRIVCATLWGLIGAANEYSSVTDSVRMYARRQAGRRQGWIIRLVIYQTRDKIVKNNVYGKTEYSTKYKKA